MAKGRVGRVVIGEFKGMNQGVSPVRLPPGTNFLDQNGRSSFPHQGSWGSRKGYQRLCFAGSGSVLQEGSSVEAIYQFTPHTTNQETFPVASVNTKSRTTTVVLVAGDGKLQAYPGLSPRT